jgi:AraC-like DNA-binding protein
MANSERLTWTYSDPQFPLAVKPVHDTQGYQLHSHDFTELVVIREGWGLHQLGEQQYPIQAGDVFVVTSDNAHAYLETHQLGLVNVLFKPEVINLHEAELRALPGYHALFTLEPHYRQQRRYRSRVKLMEEELACVTALLDRMEDELIGQAPGYRTMAMSQLLQLIIYLARRYGDADEGAGSMLRQIGEAISHIEHAYAETLTLDDLAEVANMSPRHLIRRFQESTGVSPIEYLNRFRLHRAATLLCDTALPIGAVAAAVGIPDSNYFARLFKRAMGVTPRAYRRRHLLDTRGR